MESIVNYNNLSMFSLEDLLRYLPTSYNGSHTRIVKHLNGCGYTLDVFNMSFRGSLKSIVIESLVELYKVHERELSSEEKRYGYRKEGSEAYGIYDMKRHFDGYLFDNRNPLAHLTDKIKSIKKDRQKIVIKDIQKIILLKRYNASDVIFFEHDSDIIKMCGEVSNSIKVECKKGTGEEYLRYMGINENEYKVIDIKKE